MFEHYLILFECQKIETASFQILIWIIFVSQGLNLKISPIFPQNHHIFATKGSNFSIISGTNCCLFCFDSLSNCLHFSACGRAGRSGLYSGGYSAIVLQNKSRFIQWVKTIKTGLQVARVSFDSLQKTMRSRDLKDSQDPKTSIVCLLFFTKSDE